MQEAPAEQVVRAYYSAVDCGDIESLIGLFAADARYDRPGFGTICGHAALREFYTKERVLSGGSHHLQAVISDGERVGCFGEYVGAKRTGEPVDVFFADLHVVRDGRICERRTFFFAPLV